MTKNETDPTEKRTAAPLVTIRLDTEIGGPRYDEHGDLIRPDTIADAIVRQAVVELVRVLRTDVAQTVIAEANEQITAQVRELVAGVLAEPFTITDEYGGRNETTTLRERIVTQVKNELRPTQRNYNGYHRSDREQPVITLVIEREVRKALTTELSDAVKQARDQVVASVRTQAATLIAQAVKEGLR